MENLAVSTSRIDSLPAPLRKLMEFKIGPVPLPIYLAISIAVIGAAMVKKLPIDMIGGFACIMIMGFLFSEIGARVPILRNIGGPAILCLFIPSAMLG